MALTVPLFRIRFPAFNDSAAYPDGQVGFYVGFAYKTLNADRWGSLLDEGAALFTAHFLAVDKLGLKAGTAGIPGSSVGPVNTGSVDKVSYGRDTASVMEEASGHWGMTTYGLQFLRFARMIGAGPVQIGQDAAGGIDGMSLYNGAWPGVMYPYF